MIVARVVNLFAFVQDRRHSRSCSTPSRLLPLRPHCRHASLLLGLMVPPQLRSLLFHFVMSREGEEFIIFRFHHCAALFIYFISFTFIFFLLIIIIMASGRTGPAWKHCVSIYCDGKARNVKCIYFEKVVIRGIYRLKHHLARTSKDV